MRKVVSLHWQGDKLVSARLEGDNEPIPIEGRLVIEQYIDSVDKCGERIYDGSIVRYSFGSSLAPILGSIRISASFARRRSTVKSR